MQIDDLLSSGAVRRWTLIDGFARCMADALPAGDAGVLAVLQRNAAIRALIDGVETYESAQATIAAGEPDNGEPPRIPDPAAVRPEAARISSLIPASPQGDNSIEALAPAPQIDSPAWEAPVIDNPAWALAPRMIEAIGPDGEPRSGPEPRWEAWDAAQATVAGASAPTLALARWRAGRPAEGDEAAVAVEVERLAAAAALAGMADAKAARKAALADRRWRAETGGATVAGMEIPTDAATQAKLTAAAVAALIDPAYSVNWKVATGDFVALDHDQVIALAQGARAHVQGCFDREAALAAQIDAAATPEALAAIDIEAGWPA